MSKRLLTLGIFVMLAAGIAAAQELTRNPYIQNLKPDSVEILWKTDQPAPSWVELWPEGTIDKRVYLSTVPVTMHQMRIPNLEPDSRYTYQVGSEAEPLSDPATFRTFPAGGGAPFDFVVYGDHRNNPEAHFAVAEAIRRNTAPRFILDTGDFTGDGEHATDFWDEQFFTPASELMRQFCLFPVIGNHEAGRRHPRIPFRYLENFSVPTENSGTEYYYSFDYGDAHFCMIDVYTEDFAEGSKQYAWIKQDLRQSDKIWKFAVMHYPIYIHRKGPSVSYGNEAIREHLVPLFKRYGVTMTFSGDSHFYQRSQVDGIHYVCSGGGGAPIYDPGDGESYVQASYKGFHYVWLQVDQGKLDLRAYNEENKLVDSFFGVLPRQAELPPAPVLNFTRRLPEPGQQPGQVVILETRDAAGNLTPPPVYEELSLMLSSSVKSAAEGLQGTGSRFSDNEEADGKVRFTPPIEAPGTFLISITTPSAGSVNAPNTLFEVTQGGGELIRGKVNLSASETGDRWYDIGLFDLVPGDTFLLIEVEDEPDRFYVDGVKLVQYGALGPETDGAAEGGPDGKVGLIWGAAILYVLLLLIIVIIILVALMFVRARRGGK